MRKITLAGLFLIFSAAGCGGALDHESPFDPDSPPTQQAKSSLEGTVLLEGETDHSQVTVKLQGDDRTYTTQTDTDGAVELNGVVPGTYTLSIFTRYFEPVTETIVFNLGEPFDLGERTLAAKTASVTGSALAADLNGTELDWKGGVTLMLTKTGSVRTSASGAPGFFKAVAARNVSVTVNATSENDGDYTFSGVPSGNYSLVAQGNSGRSTTVNVTVTGEDGDVEIEPIEIEPLTGFFTIEGTPAGAYTNTPAVQLFITGFQAATMQIGTSSSGAASGCVFNSAAVTYNAIAAYTLPQDGLNTVCAKFIDKDGNESDPVTRTITLDRQKPVGSVSIDNGAGFNSDSAGLATLTFSATSTYSPVNAIKIANLAAGSCEAALAATTSIAYVSSQSRYLLPAGPGIEGNRTICTSFGTSAGNWSDPVSDSIRYDLKIPAGDMSPASAVTNDTLVTFSLAYDSDATAMRLGAGSSCNTGTWTDPSTTAYWNLAAVDGPQPVSVQFRDAAGNVSDCVTRTVTLDRRGPVPGAFQISGNGVTSLYSSLITVPVSIQTGAPDCVKLELSEDTGFAFGVYTFNTCTLVNEPVVLENRQGLHQLYARYTDTLGNVGPSVAANVIVDSVAPSLTLAIDNGAQYATSLNGNVNLQLVASSSNSQVVSMKVANLTSGTCETALSGATPSSFSPNPGWLLDSPGDGVQGSRTVCASVRNQANSWSTPVSDSIIYDRLKPTGTLAFSEAITSDTLALLSLTYSGDVQRMKLSTGNTCNGGQWVDVSTSALWTLIAIDGQQYASVRFRDGAGNESDCIADSIVLDKAGPVPASFTVAGNGVNAMYSSQITLYVTATSAALDCAELEFAEDPGFVMTTATVTSCSLAAEPYELINTNQGVRNLYGRFVDALGNTGPVATASFIYDTQAPQGATVSVDKGSLTNQTGINLLMSATGADQMQVTQGTTCSGAWGAFNSNVPFTLSSGDGVYSYSVRMRDWAGNLTACLSRSVRLDQTVNPFALSVTGADGGTLKTASQFVTVWINGMDGDVTEMKASNLSNLGDAAWVPATASFTWLLQSGDGARTVYVRLRDLAGNERDGQVSITLDQTPPSTPVIAVSDIDGDGFALASNHVELSWSNPGAPDLLRFRLERLLSGPGQSFQQVATLPASATSFTDTTAGFDGITRWYRIRAEDVLGNLSGYSNLVPAEVFTPMSGLRVVNRGASKSVQFDVPPGVFSVQADRSYMRKDGVVVTEALPTNRTEFEIPNAPAGVWNDSVRIRMLNRNQDLAYEQSFYLSDHRLIQINEGIQPQACTVYALDVDSKGTPHVTYLTESSNVELRYATLTSDETFENRILANRGEAPHDVVVDAFDRVHLAYMYSSSPISKIRYARRDTDGTWFEAEIPNRMNQQPYGIAMDTDAQGRAHIAFYGSMAGMQYTRITGNTIEAALMDVFVHMPDLRIFGNSMYVVSHDGTLAYKNNLDDLALVDYGNGWDWDWVGDANWAENDYINIEIDSQGQLHVVGNSANIGAQNVGLPGMFNGFQNNLPVVSRSWEVGPLMNEDEPVLKDGGDIWVRKGGVWVKHTLLEGSFRRDSRNGRIIKDKQNRIHTLFCNQSDGRLWYGRFNADVILPARPVTDVVNAAVGQNHDLAIDVDRNPHIIYQDQISDAVGYARWITDSWEYEVVEDGTGMGAHLSMALGTTGAVHAAYEANGNIHHAVRSPDTGTWTISDLGLGYHPSITVANGQVALAYVSWVPGSEYKIYLAQGSEFGPLTAANTNMEPNAQVPGNPYMLRHPDVQFDASGYIHIAAASETLNNGYEQQVAYSTNYGGAWTHRRYGPCCFYGYWPSLGVKDGSVAYISHYAFHDDYVSLTTFHNDGGANIESVYIGGSARGGFSSLVVDQLGLPYVSLIDYANDDLLFDFYDGVQWYESATTSFTTDLVPSIMGTPSLPFAPYDNEYGLRHRLAVDVDNAIHQTYFDVDRNRIVYLPPKTYQWFQPALHTRLVPPF